MNDMYSSSTVPTTPLSSLVQSSLQVIVRTYYAVENTHPKVIIPQTSAQLVPASLSPSPTFHTSTPPSPPTPTNPLAQSTLSTFFDVAPSHARNAATALFVLRRSHRRTTPSYAPVTS